MKKRLILALFGLLLLFQVARSQSPGTTFYGVDAQPLCWTTGGGVDSTIFQVALSPAGSTKPTQMFFYVPIVGTNKVQAVTVSGGSIRPGYCSTAQGDTIINNIEVIIDDLDSLITQLDSLITLSGGGCTLSDEWRLQTITSTTTYNTNTLSSLAITAVSGTVTVNTDGAGAVTIPTGAVYSIRGYNCEYLQTEIVVTITAGSATISRYY